MRSNEQGNDETSSATARSRDGYRSNYDNVASMQPQQHRTGSNLTKTSGGQRISPGKGYNEANV